MTVAPIAKKIIENSVRDFMVVLLRDVCDMMLLNAALKIKWLSECKVLAVRGI